MASEGGTGTYLFSEGIGEGMYGFWVGMGWCRTGPAWETRGIGQRGFFGEVAGGRVWIGDWPARRKDSFGE